MKEYHVRDNVRAKQITEPGRVGTVNGLVNALAGDYLVYGKDGTHVIDRVQFENIYEEVHTPEDSGVETQEIEVFTPTGKTVQQVVEYMNDNPDAADIVKTLEMQGAGRKGIVEYEIR